MKRILSVSSLTLILISNLSSAGSLGGSDSEIEALQSDIASSQNERDALLLKSNPSDKDPAIQAKTERVEEKKKALREKTRLQNIKPKRKPPDLSTLTVDPDFMKSDPNDRDDSPRAAENLPPPMINDFQKPRDTPTKEEVVISGEGIQGEITFKKPKKTPAVSNEGATEIPSSSPTNGTAGEIIFPKKKK